ncbi:MAG: hypothetical protein KAH35_06905 [Candidatus Atribacteria bacterium]|nr:hypothetical protein [Candidatus Atribacteria bacterium]
MMRYPEYVAIGHVTNDIFPEEKMIGGSVIYSALTAHYIGYSAGIITSFGSDFSSNGFLQGIHILNSVSDHTTTFCNVYNQRQRTQFVSHIAAKIAMRQIPEEWKDAKIVHLCPIADEIDEKIFDQFKNSLTILTPQGLMRKWGEDGKVYPKRWLPSHKILSNIDIIIFSEEDIASFPEIINDYQSSVDIVILTRGVNGSILYWNGQEYSFSAFPVEVKDPTGAGDVFAAAFSIKYYQTGNPIEASRFANYIASFAVTKKGIFGIAKISKAVRKDNFDQFVLN